jgi:hypothetical protein
MKFLAKNTFALFACASLLFSSCEKNEEIPTTTLDDNGYTIPTTYNFLRNDSTTVDFSGQTQRIAMFDELSNYLKQGNDGVTLSSSVMLNMFRNENSPFADANLNVSTKNIASKTYQLDVSIFEQYFLNAAAASITANDTASNGQAGLSYNNDLSKHYLVDANGVEWRQVIVKQLMGALLYYQTTTVYLGDAKIGNTVNNTDLVNGENYTTMEHHFDEAFGYFGVPTDFPAVTTGAKYVGSYANQRNAVLGSNAKLMNAFLKGRAAIVNNDMAAKDAAIIDIKTEWELVIAGSAIHYINEVITNFGDDAIRSHELSECLGFVKSLKYNIDKTISDADIASVEGKIGTNFYNVTIADLNNAKATLVSAFGLTAVADIL